MSEIDEYQYIEDIDDVIDMPIGKCSTCSRSFYIQHMHQSNFDCYLCSAKKPYDADQFEQQNDEESSPAEQVLACPHCENWEVSTDHPQAFLDHVDACGENDATAT